MLSKNIFDRLFGKKKETSNVKIFDRLYPYQKEAVLKAIESDKGIICMPTGVGKTFVSASIIADDIIKSGGFKMYVVNAPRIVLTYQLLKEVYGFLTEAKIEARYMFVHSGGKGDEKELEDIRTKANLDGIKIPFAEIPSCTSVKEIKEMMGKAKAQDLPIVFFSTYNSAERIEEARGDLEPFSIVLNDEAHYLVQEQFHDILHILNAKRCYFFTATTISTPSDKGRGMNNKEIYGELLYKMTPREAIDLGKMVRPRLHFVTTDGVYNTDDYNKSLNKIIKDTFEQHSKVLVKTLPKVLVSVKGIQDIINFLKSKECKELMDSGVNVYAVASNDDVGNWVNGEQVKRDQFLRVLKADGIDRTKKMIVLHYDILAEGIDVSGFSGIMPFRTLSKSKFLQTFGRAARPDIEDRERIDKKEIGVNDLDKMNKPYSYIMIPSVYNGNADDNVNIITLIKELRDYGFNPNEDIISSEQIHGIIEIEQPDALNDIKKSSSVQGQIIERLNAEIEAEEQAKLSKLDLLKKQFDTNEKLSYEKAREYVHTLNLKNKNDWFNYSKSRKRPKNLSCDPYRTYKNKGWVSWGDFLGTGRVANQGRTYLSFEDAREFAHFKKFKDKKDWFKYCKSEEKPDDIPYDPYRTYKNEGWVSWGDFLDTENISPIIKTKKFKSFVEAKETVKLLDIKSKNDWFKFKKLGLIPNDIPGNPYNHYKNKGWISWPDFLGV